MPIKLFPPRPGHPYYVVRGNYLGVNLRSGRSTETGDRKAAKAIFARWKREIEGGVFDAETKASGFAAAAVSYQNAGGERTYLVPLIRHFLETPLAEIDQEAVNAAAVKLYPNASPATRNRQVYTPVSAVLRHAKVKIDLTRPKGGQGKRRGSFLQPEQAFALLSAAEASDAYFGALCVFLLYTGCRLSEGLGLTWDDVDLVTATAYIPVTKNGEPRNAFLPEAALTALANLPVDRDAYTDAPLKRRGPVFRGLHKSGRLYKQFNQVVAAAGLTISERVAFHIFRHTYGAWMTQLGIKLIDTGAWKSRQASEGYEHINVSEAARKAAALPVRRR